MNSLLCGALIAEIFHCRTFLLIEVAVIQLLVKWLRSDQNLYGMSVIPVAFLWYFDLNVNCLNSYYDLIKTAKWPDFLCPLLLVDKIIRI